MKRFAGFPAKMELTPVPSLFFSALLPQINDIAELKTTLYLLATLYRRRGYPRYITFAEIAASKSLMAGLKQGQQPPVEALRQALAAAVERGIFLRLTLDRDGSDEDIYLLNTEADRQAAAKIASGELAPAGLSGKGQAPADAEEIPDIFTLYEDNIGMLTPMIAEELKEAEKLYPADWINDAIKEAVSLNKRNWRYITRILERWSSEGKGSGAHKRDSKKADPDKYIKGKYGHMVRR